MRTSGAERGAASQNALQSPLLITRIDVGGNYESRCITCVLVHF